MIRFQLSASKFLSLSRVGAHLKLRWVCAAFTFWYSCPQANNRPIKLQPKLLPRCSEISFRYFRYIWPRSSNQSLIASLLRYFLDQSRSLFWGQHQIILKKVISLIYIDIKFRFNGRMISKTFPVSQHFIHSFIVFHFPAFSAVLPLVFGFIRSQSCCSPTHLRHAFLSLLCNISHFVFIHFHSVCCCCCAQDVWDTSECDCFSWSRSVSWILLTLLSRRQITSKSDNQTHSEVSDGTRVPGAPQRKATGRCL